MRVDARVYIKAKRAGRATSVRVAPTGTAVEQYQVPLGNRHSLKEAGVIGLPSWSDKATQTETWVKVPRLSALCPRRVIAFDGGKSDIDKTMEFGDDFDGTTINAAKWTATPGTGGSIAVANSQVTITGNDSGSSVGWATLGGSRFFDRPCIIRIAAQFKGQTTYKGSLVALRTTVNKFVDLIWFNATNKMRAENASYGDVNTNIDSNANVYELKYFDTGFAATKNGGSMTGSPITNASYIPTAAVNPQIHSTGGATYNIVVGFVAVRKYVSAEPLAGTAQPAATNRALSRPMSHADLMRACCAA